MSSALYFRDSETGEFTEIKTIIGPRGRDGKSAYEVAKENGFDGSIEDWLESLNGINGVSITVQAVNESVEDGGNNVLTFSNGTTLTIKNGNKGSDGTPGRAGVDGRSAYQIAVDHGFEGTEEEWVDSLSSINDELHFVPNSEQDEESDDLTLLTWNEREKLIQDVIEALGTPVFGRLDENKVITLSGELAPGTYTLKYDGTDAVIGTIVVEG